MVYPTSSQSPEPRRQPLHPHPTLAVRVRGKLVPERGWSRGSGATGTSLSPLLFGGAGPFLL